MSTAHSWCKSLVISGAPLDWDLVTLRGQTSLKSFEICDRVHHHAESRHQKMGSRWLIKAWTQSPIHSGSLWCLNHAQLAKSVARKYPLKHYTITRLNSWNKAGWSHAFMSFRWMYNPNFIADLCPVSVHFCWVCVNCSFSFLFVVDTSVIIQRSATHWIFFLSLTILHRSLKSQQIIGFKIFRSPCLTQTTMTSFFQHSDAQFEHHVILTMPEWSELLPYN